MDFFNKYTPIDSYLKKIQDTLSKGLEKQYDRYMENYQTRTYIRDEYCTGSSLHRGFYHPSPVYDIVVGNTQRGKLHKKMPNLSKITHHFLYGADGILDCIETYSQGSIAYVEQLYYESDTRLGVSIDRSNRISSVSEERFVQGKLVDFFILNCVLADESYECYSARSEHYSYDNLGLCACDFVVISPISGTTIQKKYLFTREDGLLTSYMDALDSKPDAPTFYTVKKKRKA